MFDFAEATKGMTAAEILNYYRNLYYTEPQVTERGIVANAINELLPNVAPVVHGEWLETRDKNKKRCSRCDVIHLIAQYPAGHIKFCPNCGAVMVGVGQ